MSYTIFTNNATKTIKTILECVKKGKDEQDSNIESWKVEKGTSGKEYIEHSPEQWVDKCYLDMIANEENDKIDVVFHYWKSSPQDQRSDADKKIILGRFTELLLVHFDAQYNKITIDK